MYKATTLLSSSSSPTQGDLRLTFLGMLTSLQRQQQLNQNNIANAIYTKLETYWNGHLSNSSAISAILDPRYKLTTFVNSEERNNYINYLQTLFSLYMSKFNITPNRMNENISQDPRSYFLNIINNNQNQSFINNSNFDEIDNYLNAPNEINMDPLFWWKTNQSKYPVLSLIAKDFLIIQATSVPSEQAFSVAGNAITQTRNRLDPETARATLCLKSWIENRIGIPNVNNENHETDETGNDNDSDDSDYDPDSNNTDSNSNSSNTDSN
jgi:hAT family C-terminal dimerisation region/Domain of unknown function (DUF4413)